MKTHTEKGRTVRATEHNAKTTSTMASGIFATLRGLLRGGGSGAPDVSPRSSGLSRRAPLLALLAVLGVSVVLPAAAGAYATPAPESTFSSAPGLPDGRVYELVSPADDNGNEAGASSVLVTGHLPGLTHYAIASAEGDSVLFEATGPLGEAASANVLFFVSTRTSSGWKTRSVLPKPQQTVDVLKSFPGDIYMSRDFSQAVVSANYKLAPLPETGGCASGGNSNIMGSSPVYLAGPDPFVSATWLSRSQTGNPADLCNGSGGPVGASPDFSTLYFAYSGTLLPEDAGRREGSGFYEDSDGVLREADVLPNGSLGPFGAVPAGPVAGVALGNNVSADGSRAFFVSPDPASCEQNGGKDNCAVDPPQLYVRENGTKTLLASRDTLLPEAGGLPASAPDGVLLVNQICVCDPHVTGVAESSYVFASSDGSQAFFQSEDRLTADAPEGPPANTAAKTYDFDASTGTLTYLPGVTGKLVGADTDGSVLAFVRAATASSPAEFDLWSAGPHGGSVTPIVQLTEDQTAENVEPVRISTRRLGGRVLDRRIAGIQRRGRPADISLRDRDEYARLRVVLAGGHRTVGGVDVGFARRTRPRPRVGDDRRARYLCRRRSYLLPDQRATRSAGLEHRDDPPSRRT